MGLVKNVKQQHIAEEARRAREQGLFFFAPMLNAPTFTMAGTGTTATSGSVSGWAEQIEAVEREGWMLQHWSVATDPNGRPQAYPLFRVVR